MILQAVGLVLPSLALIYKQPNLSTTICVAALFCVLLFLAGLSYKFVGTVLAVTVPLIALFFLLRYSRISLFSRIISRNVSLPGWSLKNMLMMSRISS